MLVAGVHGLLSGANGGFEHGVFSCCVHTIRLVCTFVDFF